MPKSTLAMDGRSFTHSPRILGGNVHNDPLFQFYYTAALISFQCGIGPRGMTGPSDTSTISGFTQGGGPDLLSAVTGVAMSEYPVASRPSMTVRVSVMHNAGAIHCGVYVS